MKMLDRKEYNREYYLQHREHISFLHKAWRTKNRLKDNAMHRRDRKRIRQKLREYFGDKCWVCGKIVEGRLFAYHQIHERKHSRTRHYILKNKEDFMLLCMGCHKCMHAQSKR